MNALEASLGEIGEASGLPEHEVAAALRKVRGELARLPPDDDALLSTMREYVKALGGEIELWAVLGDKRIRVRGV